MRYAIAECNDRLRTGACVDEVNLDTSGGETIDVNPSNCILTSEVRQSNYQTARAPAEVSTRLGANVASIIQSTGKVMRDELIDRQRSAGAVAGRLRAVQRVNVRRLNMSLGWQMVAWMMSQI